MSRKVNSEIQEAFQMYVEQTFATPAHKVGDKYHTPTEIARMLISQGFARQIVDPNKSDERKTYFGIPDDTQQAPFFSKVQWGLRKNPVNGDYEVTWQHCSEFKSFKAPLPSDCPADIVKQYEELTGYRAAANRATLRDAELARQGKMPDGSRGR
jgi:hypothetical protein